VEVGGNGAEAPPAEPHTAPHDEIIAVVRELIHRAPARSVSIDTLANALKSRGFSRTPGSPRLITRLRRIKEITVSRTGMITLIEPGARPPQAESEVPATEPAPIEDAATPGEPAAQPVEPIERGELPEVAAHADDYMEEPGDSIGNVAQPTEIAPPSYYRRPPRNDRRRYPPRPQRAAV